MTAIATLTSGLAPISLAELSARAALMTRVDRKYVLPTGDLPLLVAALPDGVRVLEIDRCRELSYESVYFDTPGLDCYLAAARRRRRRFKVRIRSYLATGQHFVEVKMRGGRGRTVKERIPYAGDQRQFGHDARAFARKVLAGAGFRPGPRAFVPVLTSCYRRTTLFLPATASRITIDSTLTWSLAEGTALQISDHVIVETKTARAASDVDRLLWSLKHRPCALSKYCTALAALRPDLPANRWQPVLRRHFPATSPP